MRVLQVISSGGMYGAETMILNLARSISTGPHHAAIVVFDHGEAKPPRLYEVAKEQNLDCFLLPCLGRSDANVAPRLREIAQEFAADVVHAHGYKADVYSYFAFRKSPLPLISTCHTWHDTDAIGRIYGFLDRQVLKRFQATVAVSDDVKNRLLRSGVAAERVHSIPNGVDVVQYQPGGRGQHAASANVIGFAARLAPEKGLDTFAETAATLLRRRPDLIFHVAGDGPGREELEKHLQSLGILDRVHLLGRVEEMAAFYANIDILLSTSRSEGFPMSMLEAMASGVPVVATDVGDVSHLVRHGETGFLAAVNDVNVLSEGALRLMEDDSQRLQFATKARAVVLEEFSARRMAGRYLELYENVPEVRPAS